MSSTSQHLQAPEVSPDASVRYDLRGDALNAALCDASAFPKHGGQSIAWLHVPKCGANPCAKQGPTAGPSGSDHSRLAEEGRRLGLPWACFCHCGLRVPPGGGASGQSERRLVIST